MLVSESPFPRSSPLDGHRWVHDALTCTLACAHCGASYSDAELRDMPSSAILRLQTAQCPARASGPPADVEADLVCGGGAPTGGTREYQIPSSSAPPQTPARTRRILVDDDE